MAYTPTFIAATKRKTDYNPHFHVLIAVNKSYFNKPNQYIKQARWLKLW